jgi:molecular chaperone DnaK
MNQSDKILGIDLGTTNSVLAVIQQGAPTLLPIDGSVLLPSVVGIADDGEVLVGKPARNQNLVAPERTVRSIKRKMGSGESVTMAGKSYTPQEISAFILRTVKEAAERTLGEPVTRAVITVPAYFNEVQRQATLEAGAIAGLTVERIINEPTASALAYGYGINDDAHRRVLVYDLGGGTFDVSIIELNSGVVDVMATTGNNFLGGDDFDERLANLVADEFQKQHKIDLRGDHRAWARLLQGAEEAKIALSAAPFTTLSLEYIAETSKGKALHIRREIERSEFVRLIDDLLQSTILAVDQALEDARLTAGDIDRILLVGGSTRIPAVFNLVARRMGQEPHLEIDPDAAVALGAAVQAGIIAGEEIDAILVDVTPMSLGIETARFTMAGALETDLFVPLVRRNTTIPVRKSEVFATMFPGQDSIEIKVYQGESQLASQNTLLGNFMVEGLTPNQADGLSKVTVDFQLDINGILNVTVTERETGKQVREQLKADRQRLSPEQIAASQAKLSAVYAWDEDDAEELDAMDELEPEIDDFEFDPATLALMDRARNVLENPRLDAALAAQIRDCLDDITDATADGNEDLVQTHSDALIDLLFEAEE